MRIEKSSSTVFTPLPDDNGVLLNLETLYYYRLNRTGAIIWKQIDDGGTITLDELVRGVCERFEVNEEAARRHLGAFVEQLEQFKMVSVA